MSECHSAEQSEAYDYMKYALVLGRNPDLSIAELFNVLGDKIQIAKNRLCVFAESPSPTPSQDFLNRLGGCVEILEIFAENLPQTAVLTEIQKYLVKKCEGHTGKFKFAVNLLPENKSSRVQKYLLTELKKSLRAQNISAAFMNKDFQNVSAVFASDQGLKKTGSNITIIDMGDNKVALGFSIALQDFEGYSKRDYGKPFRDPQAGMMPPKLAQMMINLASSPLQATSYKLQAIIDPFCGSGTILMEALLMGFGAIGSDSSNKMTEGSKKNVEWLRTNFKIADSAKNNIFTKNACSLSKADFQPYQLQATTAKAGQASYDLSIVTEPYLGPELSTFPAVQFLERVISELSDLYIRFFKNLGGLLRADTPIVIIFPVWNKGKGEKIRLTDRIIDKITSLGYSRTEFDPLKTTSLFYERPGQVVGREIVRFRKK
mgnify:FL=1